MFDLMPMYRNERNLIRYLNHREKEFWGDNTMLTFRCDVKEKEEAYLLEAELPGFEKENITMDCTENMLVITAKQNTEQENKENGYLRRERRFGTYTRSFDITGIAQEQITANYNNGILSVMLPKKAEEIPEKHRIEIA